MNKFFLALFSLPILLNSKGLDEQINTFFNNYNTKANTSSPEFINSQLGVHFLGGGGAVRTGVYDVNPIHISMPSISAGCGGIDYTLGGINIASKKEIKDALKSIASNGIGYAFLLGIETVSPVISSTMKQIQSWANQLNGFNINSCELATSLVQGAWPKSQRASSYICEHASTSDPLFTDLIEAKHGCRDDQSKRQKAVDKMQKKNKHLLVGDYNVAWKALERFNLDKETKNLFMNITGTIVVHEKNAEIEVHPPKYKEAINLLCSGGEITKGYKIKPNEVDIEMADIVIQPHNAWKIRVLNTLQSLQEKILLERQDSNVSLSEDEKDLISTTNFPIGTLISLMSQYGKSALVSLDRYSGFIALERVIKFAEDVVRDSINQAESLRSAQVDGSALEDYIKQSRTALKDLQAMNLENLQKISAEYQAIDYLVKFDRNLREKNRGIL